MPFEIFLVPGLLFALYGFYRGLRKGNQLGEISKKSHQQ